MQENKDYNKYIEDPKLLYNEAFFKNYYKSQAWQNVAGERLVKELGVSSAVDFGCGNGFYLEGMKAAGCKVVGYEYGYESLKKMLTDKNRDIVVYGNLMEPIDCGKFDLVICTEVAEHILPEKSEALLDNITRASSKYIMFSAATTEGPGTGHINLRPIAWWIDELKKRGFVRSSEYTRKVCRMIRSIPICNKYKIYMAQIIMVFVLESANNS